MDILTFAFELARVGLDNAVIQYRTKDSYGTAVLRRRCPVHAKDWRYATPPEIASLLEDAKRQKWTIEGVFGPGEGVRCYECSAFDRVMATAHPAPWKTGEGNGTPP